MAKDKVASSGSLIQELLQVGLYKRSQGKVTRQVTFAAAAIVVALGAYRLMEWLAVMLDYPIAAYAIAGTVLFLGCWIAYRVVNYPQFADFLIAVEAEMAKVSWPTRAELGPVPERRHLRKRRSDVELVVRGRVEEGPPAEVDPRRLAQVVTAT